MNDSETTTAATQSELETWAASYVKSGSDAAVANAAADFFQEQDREAESILFRSLVEKVKFGTKSLSCSMFETKNQYGIAYGQVRYGCRYAGHSARSFGGWQSFKTVQEQLAFVKTVLMLTAKKQQEKKAKREQLKAAVEAWVNTYKVGDLFHYSWGYEQTQNEFCEIVAVGPRSVTVREIVSEHVRATSHDSSRVRPVPGQYVTEPKVIRVWFALHNDKLITDLPAGDGRTWRPCKADETFHESWGH